MRKVVAVELVSVDGVMQGLGSPEEDRDGGFAHGGWGAPYAGEVQELMDPGSLEATSAYLLGRRTYETMAAFWPFQPDENPLARHLNATPKHVASRTLSRLDWAGSTVIGGDLGRAVRELTGEGDGVVTVLGSGVLVHALLRLGLVDELCLFVHPLLLGTGKRLLRELPAPRPLRLVRSAASSGGTLLIRYELGAAG